MMGSFVHELAHIGLQLSSSTTKTFTTQSLTTPLFVEVCGKMVQVLRGDQRHKYLGRSLCGSLARRHVVVHCKRLLRLASLWARLIRLSGKCLAGRIADFAKNVQSSFIYAAANELVCMGVAHPATWGIGPRTASSVVKRWLRHVKTVVCQHSHAMYSATLRATESLALYAELQPWPHLHHIVYSRHLSPVSSRFWGLARCGHHCFSDGCAARHSNTGSVPCRFCACCPDTLSHALLECSAHAPSRRRWRSQVGMNPVLCLRSLFNTRAGTNTATQIL